jgi:perosamine synthetase
MVDVPAARIVFSDDDRAAVLRLIDESLRSGSLTLGVHTASFETAFADRHGGGHAIATSSGTSALEIIFRSLQVSGTSNGGTVIVPANTFFATAAAVIHAGGTVRLADIDPHTLALSPTSLAAAITDQTVGVVQVHIGGLISPDTAAIADECRRHGLWLVEDAAHAHGSSHDGRPAGTFGVAGAFSFYPTKVVTSGEGGMILTSDDRLRDEARIYRDQGKSGFFGGDHVRLGSAWRMSEIHAAIGLVHLARLDAAIARRNAVATAYDEAFANEAGITPITVPAGGVSNRYKYVVLLDPSIDRDACKQRLRASSAVVASGEVYAKPLHRHPVFENLVAHGLLPIAEDVCARQICLPIHSDMTDAEVERVIAGVKAVLAHGG